MGVVVSYILDKIIRKKPRASNGSEVVFFTLLLAVINFFLRYLIFKRDAENYAQQW